MKLPHQKPIRFAQEVLKKEDDRVFVKVVFPYIPSLAMILESAAQSSAGFEDEFKEGFLVGANDMEVLKEIKKNEFVIEVKKEVLMPQMSMFSFKLEDFAKGRFSIYVK